MTEEIILASARNVSAVMWYWCLLFPACFGVGRSLSFRTKFLAAVNFYELSSGCDASTRKTPDLNASSGCSKFKLGCLSRRALQVALKAMSPLKVMVKIYGITALVRSHRAATRSVMQGDQDRLARLWLRFIQLRKGMFQFVSIFVHGNLEHSGSKVMACEQLNLGSLWIKQGC